jgi:hypothetical protein
VTADERLERIRAVGGAVSRIYIAPEQRIMFVSLNKNACTSLKWMMAGIMGEDLDSFAPGLLPVTFEADAIQNRNAWKHAPKLTELDPALRAEISPANGWFVYAVVRDPRNRLFSAWQNKLLLENPGYTHYRDKDWYPRHPLSEETIVEDFERFVTVLENEPDHRLRTVDPHFRDQAELLMTDVIDYTKIYEISELGRLVTDLEAHLANVGWSGEVRLPRANDTPLRVNGVPFANGVRERVEKIFAADFELFPDRWDFSKAESAPRWTEHELREAELHAAYGRRIGDLRTIALRLRDQAARERKRADRAQSGSGPDGNPTAARTLVRRAAGRARRIADRYRR